MRAAIMVPATPMPVSGGLRGLHLVSKTLLEMGVDAFTVGIPYEHDAMGDVVISYDEFDGGEDVALILPEGYNDREYLETLRKPHGPVVVYAQNAYMAKQYQPHETHYWGLGERTNAFLHMHKGVPASIEIMPLLLPVDTGWWECSAASKLRGSVLYGARRSAATLDAVARRCGDNYTVFRVAGVRRAYMHDLLDFADIFVLASDCEGQSVFANEAMAMEMAVVTWPSVGMPDIIQHEKTGLLVEQGDVLGLVDCVQRLQREPEFARELGKNARQWVIENLNHERFVAQLKAAWKAVTNGS